VSIFGLNRKSCGKFLQSLPEVIRFLLHLPDRPAAAGPVGALLENDEALAILRGLAELDEHCARLAAGVADKKE